MTMLMAAMMARANMSGGPGPTGPTIDYFTYISVDGGSLSHYSSNPPTVTNLGANTFQVVQTFSMGPYNGAGTYTPTYFSLYTSPNLSYYSFYSSSGDFTANTGSLNWDGTTATFTITSSNTLLTDLLANTAPPPIPPGPGIQYMSVYSYTQSLYSLYPSGGGGYGPSFFYKTQYSSGNYLIYGNLSGGGGSDGPFEPYNFSIQEEYDPPNPPVSYNFYSVPSNHFSTSNGYYYSSNGYFEFNLVTSNTVMTSLFDNTTTV